MPNDHDSPTSGAALPPNLLYTHCDPDIFDFETTDELPGADIVVENFVRMSSLKRAGQGSEYGKAVVYLASDLSSFVNGHVLEVTGGLETIPPI